MGLLHMGSQTVAMAHARNCPTKQRIASENLSKAKVGTVPGTAEHHTRWGRNRSGVSLGQPINKLGLLGTGLPNTLLRFYLSPRPVDREHLGLVRALGVLRSLRLVFVVREVKYHWSHIGFVFADSPLSSINIISWGCFGWDKDSFTLYYSDIWLVFNKICGKEVQIGESVILH